MTKAIADEFYKSKRGKSLLNHIIIELTERCNNNCIHCYINRGRDDPSQKRELTTKELMAVLNQAASIGCMRVTFTGGEPLMRGDFEELYLYTKKLGMSVIIRTNATLISSHLADLFAKIPPKEPIIITIYGATKNDYEAATRTPGSYEAFLKGISLLREKNVAFKLTCVITRQKIKDVDSYKSWSLKTYGEELDIAYDLIIDLSARGDKDRNKVLQRLRIPPEEVLRIRKHSIPDYDKELRAFCKKFIGPSGDILFDCGSCVGACALDSYGNLQPCLPLRHPDVVYNLKNGTIKVAMAEFFPHVREIRATDKVYLARCAHCFLRGLCELCPAKSWMEHGTLDTPVEYLCDMAHLEARNIGLLQKDEKAWEVEDWEERIKRL